ncbi:hypothetical protein BRADI_4g34933v3 [Brachypodium distachyon]|uniref:Uncharacterized protein n=1 Tax=Brachypodium distachyon TaxID=15368 RepID=A0A0Q3LEB5_BRADI|nr:hypothetical protein BRADI_4g34933v3 [Brachypodium distachyon]
MRENVSTAYSLRVCCFVRWLLHFFRTRLGPVRRSEVSSRGGHRRQTKGADEKKRIGGKDRIFDEENLARKARKTSFCLPRKARGEFAVSRICMYERMVGCGDKPARRVDGSGCRGATA